MVSRNAEAEPGSGWRTACGKESAVEHAWKYSQTDPLTRADILKAS